MKKQSYEDHLYICYKAVAETIVVQYCFDKVSCDKFLWEYTEKMQKRKLIKKKKTLEHLLLKDNKNYLIIFYFGPGVSEFWAVTPI